MIAIINPTAGGGKALTKWRRVEPRLREAVGPLATVVPTSGAELRAAVPGLVARGHREFLAGGGDGTVNAVLSALVDCAGADLLPRISVGAVGLGSSNDFHKPFRSTIAGIPCRINRGRVRDHDIGRMEYEDPQGVLRTRYWFVNASIGIAAEANNLFNHPDGTLRFLKRVSTSCGIAYAALAAIAANRPRALDLVVNDRCVVRKKVRNLGFVKNPHFAGSLRYDSPHLPDSGCFHVHQLGSLSRPGLIHALLRLARGRFAGGRETQSWFARCAEVRNGGDRFLVECDGEVVDTSVARFSILTPKVRLCS